MVETSVIDMAQRTRTTAASMAAAEAATAAATVITITAPEAYAYVPTFEAVRPFLTLEATRHIGKVKVGALRALLAQFDRHSNHIVPECATISALRLKRHDGTKAWEDFRLSTIAFMDTKLCENFRS